MAGGILCVVGAHLLLTDSDGRSGRVPEYWDGKASLRIAEVLRDCLNLNASRAVA